MKPGQPYDVCVVGSGAAGGIVAMELSKRGASVVVLEAGKWVDPTKEFFTHTMPYELPKNGRGWNPQKHLRVDPAREPYTSIGNAHAEHFLMKAVGGKSLLWAGLSWRLSPHDLRQWPLTYEELAPYYDKIERLMGVSGNLDHHPNVPDGIFLKPLAWVCGAHAIKKGIEKLDRQRYRMITARKAILTERNWSTRSACHYCGVCSRGCDSESKYTSANTAIPLALKTKRCELILFANAAEITLNQDGTKATGVRYIDTRTMKSYEVKAKQVVLACGAIEDARLLLLSQSSRFPAELANSSGLVGKNLVSHPAASVSGYLKSLRSSEVINDDGTGSGHAIIPNFYWDNPHRDFPFGYSIAVTSGTSQGIANTRAHARVLGFGTSFKREVREWLPALVRLKFQQGMQSSPERHIELDPQVKDVYGLSVPKIHFNLTSEDKACFRDAIERCSEIIEASGGVVTAKPTASEIDATHYVGTCKMGHDPKQSVVNPFGRAHDVKNLYLADGSGFINFEEKNPTLTVMAFAARCADYIHEQLRRS